MNRRQMLLTTPLALMPGTPRAMIDTAANQNAGPDELVIADFARAGNVSDVPGDWQGFSDRVMGGVSDARFGTDTIEGVPCIRLAGRVTRDSGGGFVQMARYFGPGRDGLDAAAYRGLKLTVYGNDEEYNVHLRTGDVRWYEQSYRATFFAPAAWTEIALPWSAFQPNAIDVPLDTSRILRIGLLGWMREFTADLALARMTAYR